jgi:ABC-type multidrug transport system ATPase subunit
MQQLDFHRTVYLRSKAQLSKMLKDACVKNLCDELLNRVNLSYAAKQKVGGYSGGMRQRLGIAQAVASISSLRKPSAIVSVSRSGKPLSLGSMKRF